jgi:hypothetical protein
LIKNLPKVTNILPANTTNKDYWSSLITDSSFGRYPTSVEESGSLSSSEEERSFEVPSRGLAFRGMLVVEFVADT